MQISSADIVAVVEKAVVTKAMSLCHVTLDTEYLPH